ncbi:hypothetical protein CALVIDRAFT_373634 [Calocera viscosa TUFC12733]|uniref:Uncharacterized protein n=1 Tax=Calocera viscosa (strain TUFC12733) TaxID=1330018 RepID=A0A167GR30_CALVF|nr:hypothetical protein CALVIDRAFT_373634 [Calocera viscosa TUFC12733]
MYSTFFPACTGQGTPPPVVRAWERGGKSRRAAGPYFPTHYASGHSSPSTYRRRIKGNRHTVVPHTLLAALSCSTSLIRTKAAEPEEVEVTHGPELQRFAVGVFVPLEVLNMWTAIAHREGVDPTDASKSHEAPHRATAACTPRRRSHAVRPS